MLLVLVLILVSGLFAMAETAMLTVRRTRIDQLVDEGNRAAKGVQALLEHPTRMLATVQVGMTLVSLFSAGAAAENAAPHVAQWLRSTFATGPLHTMSGTIALVVVVLTVSILTLVLGEITPKSLAVQRAEAIALIAVYPITALQTVSKPLVVFITAISQLLVRPFGATATFHPAAMSEEELKIMVEQSEEYGVIDSEEREMIHSIFDFAETPVKKVMTPRLSVTAVEADAPVDDLVNAVSLSGHSRVPIYDDNLDNIVGVVHIKDALRIQRDQSRPATIREYMRPVLFVPESKRVDDLLTDFKRSKSHIAVVRDEYGTVTGVVTIEDVLEEIVGDIQDEYDAEQPEFERIDDTTSVIDALMSIQDFNERMGTEVPTDDADTIGGFVFSLLGHQPSAEEYADWNNLRFAVAETDGRRILHVRVTRLEDPSNGTITIGDGGA